ncbi:MAG: hypothetical protein KAR44_08700 [Candidatus Aegiribacteria sp.]|nr:hypothetical protein [Candidatus Aegiribacteria sp.]
MRPFIVAITLITFISCGCIHEDESRITDNREEASVDSTLEVCREWVEYLESSDDGLWESDTEHCLEYRYLGPFVSDDDLEPAVYTPFALCSAGDTVFVTDSGPREIVALNSKGEVLWKIGGQGEGPGLFAHMSTLAVSNRYLAALNYALGRVDFFLRDGSYSHSINIALPQDIVTIDDTTFAVASSSQPGGDIHILNSESGITESFGEAEFREYRDIPRMDLMRLCYGDNGRLAIFNRYEGLIAIYDINTGADLFRGGRNYPATMSGPRAFSNSNGESSMLHCPLGGNAFCGPEGMLNVVMCNYMEDGSFACDPEYRDFAPVSPVDRYDWDGNYLDSYCIPDSCINYVTELPDGSLVGRDFAEGILIKVERL